MIIYKATNLFNNKVYIGQTNNTLDYRKSQHERNALCEYRNNKSSVYFHNALMKYGFNNFIWEQIDNANTQEELDKKEIYWINYYKSTDRNFGYNLKYGGNGGGLTQDNTKIKIGLTTKEKWNNPNIASKMLEGLRKGTETVKIQAENNYKYAICKECGMIFSYRPKDTHGITPKYCSEKCNKLHKQKINIKSSSIAANIVKEKYKIIDEQNKKIICNWLVPNFEKYKNLPLNKLVPLFEELTLLLDVKDCRTVMRCFNTGSKRIFFKELSKIYAELIGNYKN